jgi:hypothetical protein
MTSRGLCAKNCQLQIIFRNAVLVILNAVSETSVWRIRYIRFFPDSLTQSNPVLPERMLDTSPTELTCLVKLSLYYA